MRYTLRQLQVFLATAHHKNITKAAESLAMSQSAASGALKDLEKQFNIQLFDRVGKRLQTNELGERLRAKAESLMAQAHELEHALSGHLTPGNLKVGATLTIGNYLCLDLIYRYRQHTPNAQISLEVANTEKIAEEILNFDIDVGLIEGEFYHPDIDIIPWKQDTLTAFCHPSNPLAGKRLSATDLHHAPWILREPGSGTRQAFDRAMAGIGSELNIVLELQHTEAIKNAVEKDLGISCLSEITLRDDFKRGTLVPIEIPNRNFDRSFYFLIHKQKYKSAGILKWMELCEIGQKTALHKQ
ncbi:MAG: LysR family transcriptional regulator [Agarilytica sp.]